MTQTMTPPANVAQGQPQYKITEADNKRRQRIFEAWKAYDGELEKPLNLTEEGIDPNVMSNQCQPIVEAGVNFLFGRELEITIGEKKEKKKKKKASTPDQDFLDKIWGEKETRVPLLQDLGMNGAMARNAFLRIVPTDDTFRLVVVDPSIVYIQTAPQDCETVTLYCIQYSETEMIDGRPQQVFYREEMAAQLPELIPGQITSNTPTSWTIQHWTQVGAMNMQPRNGNWIPAGEPIVWPYKFAPLFKCKNLPRPNEPWGTADLVPNLIGMNKALNVEQSCTQLNLILYGHPILYAPGMGEGTIRNEPGRIIQLPLPENKIEAVDIHSDIANGIAFADEIRSNMDEQSGVPGVAVGRAKAMPRGQMSGIAIELFFMSILKKNDKKRCLYGDLIINVSKALLELNGMNSDVKITLGWQDALPNDVLAAVQAAVLKGQVGISETTRQRELGYDPEEELELSQSEDERKLEQQQQMMAVQGVQPGMQQPGRESPFMNRGQ